MRLLWPIPIPPAKLPQCQMPRLQPRLCFWWDMPGAEHRARDRMLRRAWQPRNTVTRTPPSIP
eukprot:2163089-Amphidinium_carterae.1